ncbi:ABC transporter, ATP-binding protein [Fibrobacter succinogenes subsp. succinogenes S85]|uniref:ATP-binding protein Uup n=1 Tax=Fibrobacter succinogenes (strain ATCC 19169 / S85) TaxID=59374 RepID=C9RRA4_FIBSS|nr:ATP-binding cassette domain-containing protein [Fibrobacter succinogenes]ACX75090.1 ABC transporter related protein [Fibrobacter succinogenes subsp. succinogenes S85]ADL26901.1 ABC transporter, ATP-binding protein [Fibrobacter succinogenes subsp. succinogenes S85]
MPILSVQNILLRFGGPPLLDNVSFDIEAGDRICLVGRNGEGKSTLLKVLTGEMEANSGEIVKKTGLKVSRMIQEIPAHIDGTVRDIVMGRVSVVSGGSVISQKILDDGAHNATAEAILGKTGIDADAPYDSLSGGQKRRVLFARAVAEDPDLLLLDEPTNHLDIPAIQWLEGIVTRLNCAVMFVSHDRAFVRRTATRIFELDRGRVRSWDFPYDKFVQFRDQALAEEEKANALFDKKLAEEEVWIRKGIQARRTRNEGRVRALIKMREERAARRSRTGNVNMQITEADRSGRLVARLKNVSYSYDGSPLISDLSTEISRGDRIGIVGPNGSGKTTLLRLILGELQPESGEVRLGSNLHIAYFDQMRTRLREDKSLIENIGDGQAYITLNGVKRHVLSYLQDFLFSADRARGPISALSGGERNRLLLACLFSHPSNVLVLDEPTNDLDMETLDLLAELLADYNGTVLTVSHDRAFLDSVATGILAIEDGGHVFEAVGGYSDYEANKKIRDKEAAQAARLAAEREAEKQARSNAGAGAASAAPAPAKKKKRSYNEEREYAALPEKIEKLEKEIADYQLELSKPEVYTNATLIVELQKKIADDEALLEQAYERFEALDNLG